MCFSASMSLNFDWFNEVIGWLKSVSAEKSVQLTNKQLHTITEQEAAEEKKMPQKYLSFGLCHFVWVTWRWTITWHLSFSGWFVRCAVFFLRLLLCSALSLSPLENCHWELWIMWAGGSRVLYEWSRQFGRCSSTYSQNSCKQMSKQRLYSG